MVTSTIEEQRKTGESVPGKPHGSGVGRVQTYTVHPHQLITDQRFEALLEDGFLILPGFIPEDELPALQAAQRRCLKPWDEVKDNPPPRRDAAVTYPYPDVLMSRLYLHPELLKLARRFLKTEAIHVRVGYMLARYPGFVSNDPGHIDNGNNSLLPMSESAREYGQIVFWLHFEEVGPDQAPLRLVRKKDGKDMSKAVRLVGPPGTIGVMSNYTCHASTSYERSDGQRFVLIWMAGRADHYFEGFQHHTMLMDNSPVFRSVVSSLSAEERTLFRFPPPGHPYYTRQTLAALEQQYPGWNARGEYQPAD